MSQQPASTSKSDVPQVFSERLDEVLNSIGDGETPNWLEPDRLNTGITLVGRNARVPGGVTIGRNVLIAPNVDEEHFTSTTIASGESVDRLATALLS